MSPIGAERYAYPIEPACAAERYVFTLPVTIDTRARADARPVEIVPSAAIVARVGAIVAERLRGDLSVAAIARALKMSPRTLQRRLGASSTRLSDVVDRARRDRALADLRAGATAAEITYALGFSETRAFFRAFRRWTGTTPEAWRTRSRRDGS
jgi:AraC-like DNA-binding protein